MDGQGYSHKYDLSGQAECLVEYAIHAENGEPEGDVFAEDAAEAAQLWAMENLHNGQYRLLQVMEGCTRCGWFQVERDADSATAKAWQP